MSAGAASKVTAGHLARAAYLYVRHSTLRQVLTNTESTARQYALRQKAIALGWPTEQVITIDVDQGQSGASAADREGFQRLVADVGMGRAGIVLGLEVSRLARNNADWHRLLEICALSGTLICDEDGLYNPWVNFTNLPASDNLTFASWPASNFATLPTVSFVIPNLCDDMHDCSISTGDAWLQSNINAYAQWAKAHNSVLIVTWDEDDSSTTANKVATIFYGAGVKPGNYGETITHYNVLRTIEDAYGLPYAGASYSAAPITDIWASGTGTNTVTVNRPPDQTSTAGTAIAPLQIQASDSASGQTLTYSASGLPAGLWISTSGLITGTPSASGTSSVIVTATDPTGANGSTTFNWTVNSAPSHGLLVSGRLYEIRKAGTSEVIDDPGYSMAPSTQLDIWSNHGGYNQMWTATANPDGSYTFKNHTSGLCMEDAGGAATAGNPIIQNTCNGQSDQNWTLVTSGSGYALVNQASGLSITSGGTTDGSTLAQQSGTTTAWTFTQVSLGSGLLASGGMYEIRKAGTSEVIDDPGYSMAPSTQLDIWSNHGGYNQMWTATANPDGSYTFKNHTSGLCMEDAGGAATAGNPIIQNTCNGQSDQNWTLVTSGSGYALVNQASGLSITSGGTTDGSTLAQQSGTTTAWTFTSVTGV